MFEEIEIESWNQLKGIVEDYSPIKDSYSRFWVFRGQGNSNWKLMTTLERAELVVDEIKMIDEFKRNAHLYIDSTTVNTTLEWISLMQHYGAPTRLLDWTKSPYVAIFFAMNNVEVNEDYSSLFAINIFPIISMIRNKYKGNSQYEFLAKEKYFSGYHFSDKEFIDVFHTEFTSMEESTYFEPLILPVVPFHSHVRLNIQQGLFLCGTRVVNSGSFEDILSKTLVNYDEEQFLRKYIIPHSLKPEIINELNYMNINDSTLFPGIEGFSKYVGKKYALNFEKIKAEVLRRPTR